MPQIPPNPKIAVVGCGALGSFYGAKLCHAGCQTHFLLRSDYEVVRRDGVLIKSSQGDIRVFPTCAARPDAIGVCDLVLIGLKTTANCHFEELLKPLVDAGTMIVTLQNGLGNEECLADLFGAAKVLGGLCFVCLNRVKPGVIHHMAHGEVVLGEFQGPIQTRTKELAALFNRAGITCRLTANLAQTHWEKLVWNIPFNGLGVAGLAGYEALRWGEVDVPPGQGPCLATDVLLADGQWEQIVRELMKEVIHTAQAFGYAVELGLAETMIAKTRLMGSYKASTLLDYEQGKPLETEGLFMEPLRRAQSLGVETPRLAALCKVLQFLDAS